MFQLDFSFRSPILNRCNINSYIINMSAFKKKKLILRYRRGLQDIDIPDISEAMFAPSTQLDFA